MMRKFDEVMDPVKAVTLILMMDYYLPALSKVIKKINLIYLQLKIKSRFCNKYILRL